MLLIVNVLFKNIEPSVLFIDLGNTE